MSKPLCATLLAAALCSGACGSSSNNNPTDSGADTRATDAGVASIAVSGTAAPHPLSAIVATASGMGPVDFSTSSMVGVALADPTAALANPSAPPPTLVTALLDTTPANCGGTAAADAGVDGGGADGGSAALGPCAWSFPTVNVSMLSIGLVGIIDNSMATNRLWVRTGTGIASQTTINMLRASGSPLTRAPLFAISRTVEGFLAGFAGTALSQTFAPGDLEARGFLIGHVVTATAAPVAGATVSVPAAGSIDILYPDATFQANGTATANHGIFIGVPRAGTGGAVPFVATWHVTPPASGAGSTLTWMDGMAGTSPNNAFVIFFAANAAPTGG
jgi:hypothetical protein